MAHSTQIPPQSALAGCGIQIWKRCSLTCRRGIQHVHSTIITASADAPLLQLSSQTQNAAPPTPLETNHAAFVVNMAHLARFIMSLRMLDTGTARDVSGVMRVTRGADDGMEDNDNDNDKRTKGTEVDVEERELLYFIGGDGGVSVFERGA